MSKRNIFAVAMFAAAMFAGTAAADGKTKRVYKPGPAPLNTTCPTGYLKDTSGRCVRTTTPRTTTCPSGYTRTNTGQCIRTTTTPRTTTCPSGYTRDNRGQCIRLTQTRPAPAPRPVAPRPAPVQQASMDLTAFTGGVGAGISGGYYGGNGFVPLAPVRRFSGVLDAPGSAFTFNRTVERRGGNRPRPKPRPPMPKPPMPKPPMPKPGCGGCGGK